VVLLCVGYEWAGRGCLRGGAGGGGLVCMVDFKVVPTMHTTGVTPPSMPSRGCRGGGVIGWLCLAIYCDCLPTRLCWAQTGLRKQFLLGGVLDAKLTANSSLSCRFVLWQNQHTWQGGGCSETWQGIHVPASTMEAACWMSSHFPLPADRPLPTSTAC